MLPCQIFSVDSDSDGDDVEAFSGRDFWDVLEDVERLFRRCGINIASYEDPWSACLTSTGEVVGATVVGNAGYLDEDGEPEARPTIRFSVVVDDQVRRKGIARELVQGIVDAYPSEEFILEAWVINPHMVSLLTEFGFETMNDEWSLNSPMMTRQNPDEETRNLEREWHQTGDLATLQAWIRNILRRDPESEQLDPFRCGSCEEVSISTKTECSKCGIRICEKCQMSLDPDPMVGWCRVCGQLVCTRFIPNHNACSFAYYDLRATHGGGDHPYFICKTHD